MGWFFLLYIGLLFRSDKTIASLTTTLQVSSKSSLNAKKSSASYQTVQSSSSSTQASVPSPSVIQGSTTAFLDAKKSSSSYQTVQSSSSSTQASVLSPSVIRGSSSAFWGTKNSSSVYQTVKSSSSSTQASISSSSVIQGSSTAFLDAKNSSSVYQTVQSSNLSTQASISSSSVIQDSSTAFLNAKNSSSVYQTVQYANLSTQTSIYSSSVIQGSLTPVWNTKNFSSVYQTVKSSNLSTQALISSSSVIQGSSTAFLDAKNSSSVYQTVQSSNLSTLASISSSSVIQGSLTPVWNTKNFSSIYQTEHHSAYSTKIFTLNSSVVQTLATVVWNVTNLTSIYQTVQTSDSMTKVVTTNSTSILSTVVSKVKNSSIHNRLVSTYSTPLTTALQSTQLLFSSPSTLNTSSSSTLGLQVTSSKSIYLSSSTIKLREPSQHPSNFSAKVLSPTAVLLFWDSVANDSVNGIFRGYWIEIYRNNIFERNYTTFNTSYNVTNLLKFTNYTFSISVMNQVGKGPAANLTAQTLADFPEAAPSNFSAKVLSSTAVLLFWDSVANDSVNGIFRGYLIEIYRNNIFERNYTTSNTSYNVTNLLKFKNYTFWISVMNQVGKGPAANLTAQTLADLPEAPRNVSAKVLSSTAILLFWGDSVANDSINGIFREYSIGIARNNIFERNYATSNTSYNVTNLLKFTNYTFWISVRNQVGQGPGANLTTSTLADFPKAAPGNLSAKVLSSTAIVLFWDSVANDSINGIFRGYLIEIYRNKILERNYTTPNTSYNVTNLLKFKDYTFWISVRNQVGQGPGANVTAQTLADFPGAALRNVSAKSVSSTAVNLLWSPIPDHHMNGVLEGYLIEIFKSNIFQRNFTTTETSYDVTNLLKFTNYTFSISVMNQVGKGPVTNVTAQTLADLPGIVSNLTCEAISAFEIIIRWKPPTEPNGVITYYQVDSEMTKNFEHEEYLFDANTIEKSYKGLKPFSTYNFSVEAKNIKGFGPKSEISCQTKETVPSAPTELFAKPIRSYWFKLSWKEPSKPSGEVIGYQVSVKDIENGHTVLIENCTCTTFNVSKNIQPYKQYESLVYARTSVGYGSPAALNVTTLQSVPSSIRELNYTIVTATSVRIEWKEPEMKNGVVYYKLFKKVEGGEKEIVFKEDYRHLNYVFENLKPYMNYTFSVQSYTLPETGGKAPKISITVETKSSKPGTPTIQEVTAISNRSIVIKWTPLSQKESNGVIDRYDIMVVGPGDFSETISFQVSPGNAENELSKIVDGLKPYTTYDFKIRAHNQWGYGEFSKTRQQKTKEGRPGKPENLQVFNVSGLAEKKKVVNVTWLPPKTKNGVVSYKVVLRDIHNILVEKQHFVEDPPNTYFTIKDLDPYAEYIVEVQAKTVLYGDKVIQKFITIAAPPLGPPLQIEVQKVSPYSITLEWRPPTNPNGVILSYIIKYKRKDYSEIIVHSKGKELKVKIEKLLPFTRYTFKIACKSNGGDGPFSEEKAETTSETAPVLPPSTAQPTLEVGKTIKIQMWKPNDDNGMITFFYIVVLEKDGGEKPAKDPQDYSNDELKTQSYDNYIKDRRNGRTIKPYITANVTRQQYHDINGTFLIGKPKQTFFYFRTASDFVNGPLFPDVEYFYFIRAHINEKLSVSSPKWRGPNRIRNPITSETSSPNVAGPVAGSIIAVIIVAAVIIGFIYRDRIRPFFSKKDDQPVNGNELEQPPNQGGIENEGYEEHVPAENPIILDNFPAYVRNLAKDGKYLFNEEFKLILHGRSSHNCLAEHSSHPLNRDQNRYHNIVAYDHTRVLLERVEGIPESDYINANYIDGYMEQAAYIASQGPLENTCESFWRMCWERDVSTIVMLTQLIENGKHKCYPYWPDVGTNCYGVMQVTLTESSYLPIYSMRVFSLIHEQYPGCEKFIRHFSFCAWPDHGTPDAQRLLTFIRRVNQNPPISRGPVVVHCSAGVGRTGTYIVLDVNIKRILTERNIEIYNYLQHIRSQRNYMVQTESQYVFIHDALLEYLTFGTTEVQLVDVRGYVKKLQSLTETGAETYLDKEFQKLNHFDQSSSRTANAANSAYNKSKNRFLNVLPYDETRVSLAHMPGIPGSDYINANYVNGYSTSRLFIATQAPLPQTIPEFWRMVWEHQCMSIVCLAEETENGKVKIHRYWPSIEAAMHGTLMIENIDEKIQNDYIIRDFKVTHTIDGLSRKIRHFQYTSWPDNSNPESASGLVDMIGQVQKWHAQNGIGQIVVHCSAGVGRTGVFIGLCNLIERVRVEGFVDVFQEVREMRGQRPAMVQTKAQYLFCYLTLLDFLASFDIYQNFT